MKNRVDHRESEEGLYSWREAVDVKEDMMELKEALKDTGIAEAWYDGYTAVVVKEGAHYTLTVQRGKKPPNFVREGISLEQAENEMHILNPSHLTDWSVVELEG